MKMNLSAGYFLFVLIAAVAIFLPSGFAQSALPTEFQQAVADFQKTQSIDDSAKVIKLAVAMPQLPPVPEEARKHFVMGETMFKEAKSPDDFLLAQREFYEAVRMAPWWPEARWNNALGCEAAGYYDPALANLKLYQLFKLSDAEARTVQDKIYAVEAKQKMNKSTQQPVAHEAEHKNNEVNLNGHFRNKIPWYTPTFPGLDLNQLTHYEFTIEGGVVKLLRVVDAGGGVYEANQIGKSLDEYGGTINGRELAIRWNKFTDTTWTVYYFRISDDCNTITFDRCDNCGSRSAASDPMKLVRISN